MIPYKNVIITYYGDKAQWSNSDLRLRSPAGENILENLQFLKGHIEGWMFC